MSYSASKTLTNGGNNQLVRRQVAGGSFSGMNAQKTIGTFVKLVQHIGLWSGTRLFFQLLRNDTDRLRLPGIRHPISLRKGTSDVMAFNQVFLYREYAIQFQEEPQVVIDGGANIGMFTVFLKNRFPDAKIICIEPDKENFQQLLKNLSGYEGVHFENSGLWHREAKLKVWDKFHLGKWAMVVEEHAYNANVNAVSINSIMKKYDIEVIDVLKLDIESSEKELFSENFEPWLAKTKMIIIELHDSMKAGCAKQFFETVNKVYSNYEFSFKGENVIIVNKGLK